MVAADGRCKDFRHLPGPRLQALYHGFARGRMRCAGKKRKPLARLSSSGRSLSYCSVTNSRHETRRVSSGEGAVGTGVLMVPGASVRISSLIVPSVRRMTLGALLR